MGKRLRTQRRGKGSNVYKAKKRKYRCKYIPNREEKLAGEVIELIKSSGIAPVIAKIKFENNKEEYTIAAEGMYEGQRLEYGDKANIAIGNVLPLRAIPEGCPVFNIESEPGDGGKFVRSTGSFALLIAKTPKGVQLKLPSGKMKIINPEARATIGCVSAGGRTEKPFIKAGAKHYAMLAKGKPYPKVRGVAMNAVDHPFGGEQHHPGKSKSVSRHAPPGRKVGAIASKRTGRRKKN